MKSQQQRGSRTKGAGGPRLKRCTTNCTSGGSGIRRPVLMRSAIKSRRGGRALMGELLQSIGPAARERRSSRGTECEHCGQELTYKGQPGRGVEHLEGETRFKRAYYHCAHCEGGLFPPGPAVKVGETQLESGDDPTGGGQLRFRFHRMSERRAVFEQLTRRPMSKSSLQGLTVEYGVRLVAIQEQEAAGDGAVCRRG